MVEFSEVMEQAQRMCKYMNFLCDECPIRNHSGGCQLKPWEEDYVSFGEVEKRVMQWAKEHPEPQYPTWGEWLVKHGIVIADKVGGGIIKYNTLRKVTEPIPADIAEKLGLKPKEANGDG